MTPAVFLDRDNTLIYNEGDLGDPDLVELTRGAASAVASLRGLGYKIVVVTNQGGVARGLFSEDDVHAVHQRISDLVKASANGSGIDAFYYCPYSPHGNLKQYKKDHDHRKPNPGMLLQAAEDLKLDLKASWMIGDRLTDVQAGHRAGARTVLLRSDAESLRHLDPAELAGVVSEQPDSGRPVSPDFFASGLIEACRIIAQQRKPETGDEGARLRAAGRKWDKSKIAALQKQRPAAGPDEAKDKPVRKPGRAFRPWGAAEEQEEEKPIVAKPFRKKLFKEDEEGAGPETPTSDKPDADKGSAQLPAEGEPMASPDPPPQPAEAGAVQEAIVPATERASEPVSVVSTAPAPRDIPDNIRQAIEAKRVRSEEDDAVSGAPAPPGPDKTLRLILQELRMQRNATAEFSYLTVVALVLQIIAVICLIGALWMGGAGDGMFLRWMGVAVMAQLSAIATLQFER